MAESKGPSRPVEGEGAGILRAFGRQQKILRERVGITQPQLAGRIGYSEFMVGAVEQGRRIPRPEYVDQTDVAVDAGGLLKVMKEELARVRYPTFFEDFAALEKAAVELHAYDPQVVWGLLQTEEYARAVLQARRPPVHEDIIQQRVAARLDRQAIFDRQPVPILSFVLEETVLRRPIGGKGVLRGQLEHLLLTGQRPNVEIQVMPTDREDHACLDGALTLLETEDQGRIAYVEVQGTSQLIMERERVREIEGRYGIIRAQALAPRESLDLIEKVLGEL
ncbi:helix-turn-helix domain-containing protein [Streptomyces sp. NBC_01808]|uniref:helix-turn-helix domain-containing protein n=1 Tax=Streptomyces sp. NBC_01808 TaxID=2975947 RepID=UPI002DD876B4|nr:helix-turn-helix transcriptional regulator [Streptomyces sp. NBC_01808]WSA38457.1 helix-turn-helix domain-containing protein [Streptomyces sp. NBC_01808]